MEPRFKYLLLNILVPFFALSQNLVPNYSFEQHDTCPYSQGQITFAIPWFQPVMNGSTTDYFHMCATVGGVSVPSNVFGYQYARTDSAYAGIGTYAGQPNYREYVEVKLNDSLMAGRKYCVEFYVSLADFSQWGTNMIGAYFSTDSVLIDFPIDPMLLSYTPQISNPANNIITDTVNWMKISGQFIAVGGEKFMTIGSFADDNNTDTIFIAGGSSYTYYYIDDVSVYLCDTILPPQDCNVFVPNAFSPNNDGQNDVLHVRTNCVLSSLEFAIYDRWGEKVFETTDITKGWDGMYKGDQMNTAVFMYYLKGTLLDGKEVFQKGDISLIR